MGGAHVGRGQWKGFCGLPGLSATTLHLGSDACMLLSPCSLTLPALAVSATHGGSSGATSLTTSEVREVIRTDGRLETFTKHYSSATATAAAAAPTPATQERSSGHAGSSHQTTAHAPSGHTAAPAAAAGPALPPTAPNVPPMSEATIEQLVEAVEAARNVLVITGRCWLMDMGVVMREVPCLRCLSLPAEYTGG